jgi:hypothetical protein
VIAPGSAAQGPPAMSGRRRFVIAVAGVVVLATAGGCGVPVDEGARPVADENVPFGLLAPGTGPPPTAPPATTTPPP